MTAGAALRKMAGQNGTESGADARSARSNRHFASVFGSIRDLATWHP